MDFERARVFVEFGPGEGCHSREIARRMHPDAQLFLMEIDPVFVAHLRRQFDGDSRIHVIQADAQQFPDELASRGLGGCDYVLSGIPLRG